MLIIAFLLFASSPAFSQAGTAGFQILMLGYSARDLSLSSSADAVTKEPVAVFTNPAGLALENESALDFMLTHRTYFGGTTIDMFGTRFEAGSVSFGTSLLLSSVPDIEARTAPSDDPQSTFSAQDFAFAFGAASSFDRVDVGISLMYLYEKLFVYESQGYAVNFGLNYSLNREIELGLSAGNLGSSSAMISEKIALPAFVRIGASYIKTIDDNFRGTGYIGVVTFKSGGIMPSVGAELNYHNFLNLRAGYATATAGTNFTTGFSFGAGINYSFLTFDYSYIPMKLDFGNSQTFTLSFNL
ncbi:MAG: PorV/PorQ family protein [Candidatus Kryptoniota bacterium]